MLDFYIINDNQSSPAFPEQLGLEFVGGLNDIIFENLQNKEIIDTRFDYYSDFRLDVLQIRKIRQNIIQKKLQNDSDVKSLIYLLDFADNKQSGLIAFGD